MAADKIPPTSYISANLFMQSTTIFAAALTHEALHSKLYHDFLRKNPNPIVPVPDEIYSGELVEKQGWDLVVQVLREIGAPVEEIVAMASAWDPKSNRYWEVPLDLRDW